jgi:hypothetical protein
MRGVLSASRLLRRSSSIYDIDIGNNVDRVFIISPPGIDTEHCVMEITSESGNVSSYQVEKGIDGGSKIKITFAEIPSNKKYKVTIVGF